MNRKQKKLRLIKIHYYQKALRVFKKSLTYKILLFIDLILYKVFIRS